ncbi:universal stress protein [Streptomyces sp. JJ36]|uniref:universal stress protein n=1 Tax=Streptomyces sp. JJ36 TaxID=2736645 RepID=UPI001F3B53A2|nr:universal stress protein [Streptomyces sp. JJ36]MCF6525764.1 universal stress protein [Streptomyces sp. JJ36]
MTGQVAAGVDGTEAGLAAAHWAAREAEARGVPLTLVHAWERREHTEPGMPEGAGLEDAADRLLRSAQERIRSARPGLEVHTRAVSGSPVAVLLAAAEEADLLALGSRGLSGVGGFLTGSVSLHALAEAPVPAVLVRAEHTEEDEHEPDSAGRPSLTTPRRPVVVGLDLRRPSDALLDFAFRSADRTGAPLRAVHAWDYPPTYGTAIGSPAPLVDAELRLQEKALTGTLRPWRERFPSVEVTEDVRSGRAGHHLIRAAHGAGLVVVGRRARRRGWHTGHVAHAVLHHASAPVAVVPHT